MAVPWCPDLAASGASMASPRMRSMACWSNSGERGGIAVRVPVGRSGEPHVRGPPGSGAVSASTTPSGFDARDGRLGPVSP